MSAWLRRRRAEQTLQREYHLQRDNVLRAVRGKLTRDGVHLDDADLDAFYNQAWHGVYGQILEGVQIDNPPGLLVRVTYCRAVDEYRKLHVARRADGEEVAEQGVDPDAAQRLDDEAKLRQFAEGLKDRLSPREREAATLCYLVGLSRPEAAERLGVEPRRMEKIMDAVSKKVGEFVRDIEAGAWCERRGSLMRAYALGVLDPEGERHLLAREHLEGCPGCRAYVRSLRGLGAVLPPVGLPFGDGLLEPVRQLLDGLRELLGAKLATPIAVKVATGCVVVAAGGGAVVAAAPAPAPPEPRAAQIVRATPEPTRTPAAPAPLSATPPEGVRRERRAARVRVRPSRRPERRRTATPAPTPVATPTSTPVATAPAPAPALAPAPRAAPATPPAAPAPPPAQPPADEFSFERGGSP